MIKLIKCLSRMMGYKIAMVKIGGQPQLPGVTIDGDKELLRYLDITGYSFKKEPLKRTFPKDVEFEPIKPLTDEQLKALGFTINVDVTDCKNYKEASKIMDQINNKEVKIQVWKKS